VIRTLALLARRSDVTRKVFREHYEEVHAPLALPLLTGLTRYVRNHVVESFDAEEPRFDVLTEFTYRDRTSFERVSAALASEPGAAIRRDELRFMDKPRNRFVGITPRGELRCPEGLGELLKLALLVRLPTEASRPESLDAYFASMAPLLDAASGWMHWETYRLRDAPVCDAASFVWYAGDRLDLGELRAWRPNAERVWRLRVLERSSRLESSESLPQEVDDSA
jgi:uncharacterized protein (TIGR02118 family)